MLFILTGEIQTGKTRWLEQLIQRLMSEGINCAGVLAPGVWQCKKSPAGESPEEQQFEKLGIENVLLPKQIRIPFAQRTDLSKAAGSFDKESQAARAKLGWAIDDKAIQQVNAHFEALAAWDGTAITGGSLLVVDELGRLELKHNGGLTSAMKLLDKGPSSTFPHALIVVRSDLVPAAQARFEPIWGKSCPISPNEQAEGALRQAFGLDDS